MEATSERKRKHITEAVLYGFDDAQKAIIFGNTVEHAVQRTGAQYKFRQSIASSETKLAITEDWTGDTYLKINFLELDRDLAILVRNKIEEIVNLTEGKVEIEHVIVRGKPQPQIINLNYAKR